MAVYFNNQADNTQMTMLGYQVTPMQGNQQQSQPLDRIVSKITKTSTASGDSVANAAQTHTSQATNGNVSWYQTPELQFCVSTVLAGLASYYTGQTAKASLEIKAKAYESQASYARVNQRLAKTNIMYAYEQGAYEALCQGQHDAQEIAATRTKAASRGVRLNTGSTAEIEASQKINAKVNQIKIQQNTVARANEARMQLAVAKGEELVALGNAEAADILAGTYGGWGSFITGAISGAVSYIDYANSNGLDLFNSSKWGSSISSWWDGLWS